MWKSFWTLLCAVTLAPLSLFLQLLLGPQLVRDKGDAGVGHPSQLAGFDGGRAGGGRCCYRTVVVALLVRRRNGSVAGG
jgi:hypothetical protein